MDVDFSTEEAPTSPLATKRAPSKSPGHASKRPKTLGDGKARRITLSTSKASNKKAKSTQKSPSDEKRSIQDHIIDLFDLAKHSKKKYFESAAEKLLHRVRTATRKCAVDISLLITLCEDQLEMGAVTPEIFEAVFLLAEWSPQNRQRVEKLILERHLTNVVATVSPLPTEILPLLVDLTCECDEQKELVANLSPLLYVALTEATKPTNARAQAGAVGVLANLAGHEASRYKLLTNKTLLEHILKHFFRGVALQRTAEHAHTVVTWNRVLVLAGRLVGHVTLPEFPLDALYENVLQGLADSDDVDVYNELCNNASIFMERVLFDPLYVTQTTEQDYYQVTQVIFDLQLHPHRESIYRDWARVTLSLPRLVELISQTPLRIWNDAGHFNDMLRQASLNGLESKDITACSQYGHYFTTLAQIAAAEPANRQAMVQAGGIAAVVGFLKASFRNTPDENDGWFHRTQQRGALQLLAELCRHHEAYDRLQQAKAFPILLRILDNTSDEIQDNHVAFETLTVLGRVLGHSGLRRHSTIKTRLPGMVYHTLKGMGQLYIKQGLKLRADDRKDLLTLISFIADLRQHFPDIQVQEPNAWRTSLELFRDELHDDHFFGMLVSKALHGLGGGA